MADFRISRGGSTLDLNDGTTYLLRDYNPKRDGNDTAIIDILAANVDAAHDALIALGKKVQRADRDGIEIADGIDDAQSMLLYKPTGATTQLQAPLLEVDWDKSTPYRVDNTSEGKIALRAVNLKLKRAPAQDGKAYFEESAETVLQMSVAKNNYGASIDILAASMRGDLAAPLIVEVYPASGAADKLVAFMTQRATPANHYVLLEADTGAGGAAYSVALGSETADEANAAYSNGHGAKVTPLSASNLKRVTFTLAAANLKDLYGYKRVLVRVLNNHGSNAAAMRLQARTGVWDGANAGGYGTFTRKAASTAFGALHLVEAGIVRLPSQNVGGAALQGALLELWAQSTLSSGWTTFVLDAAILAEAYGGAGDSGFMAATFPRAMATGARGVLDASAVWGKASAYMRDGSGNVLFGAINKRGYPLLMYPDKAARLYVLALTSSTNAHSISINNNIVVSTRFRYSYARGA